MRAKEIASEFAIPRICRSLDEICGIEELHAIDVVTPEETHLEPVLKAFERGKHVFVEKPLATDLRDCGRMIAEAEKTGRYLMQRKMRPKRPPQKGSIRDRNSEIEH